jgi:ATP-binding cassette subfamily C protein
VNRPSIGPDLVRAAFEKRKAGWFGVILFSVVSNLLMLTGSVYMMHVYDRVLSSRSIATLVALTVLALAAYALQGILDHLRLRILSRMGTSLDLELSPYVVKAAMSPELRRVDPQAPLRLYRDLDAVRNFLSGMGPTAIIDLPFTPIFLIVCFILHPTLGWLILMGLVVIVALTLVMDQRTLVAAEAMSATSAEQSTLMETSRRNAEMLHAMGMGKAIQNRFDSIHARHVSNILSVADASGGIGSFARVLRYVLQSATIGLGALLVIRGDLSAGALLAASVLSNRAMAPIELAIAHWKGFVAARQGFAQLRRDLPRFATVERGVSLPRPSRTLSVEDIVVCAREGQAPILTGVSFRLAAGQALGLVGSSGSGKSTLARALVGAAALDRGVIRLDGAARDQWDPEVLGAAIGYLPQEVELFPGTVATNIARMKDAGISDEVLTASLMAGAHDMIVRLPQGYDTPVGEGGVMLSGGQRQRIGLARALYGDPFLVMLDEPNSSLDAEGDAALTAAIHNVKARGGIVLVISHRPAGLTAVDFVGIIKDGRLRQIGRKDDILPLITGHEPAAGPAAAPLSASVAAPMPMPAPAPTFAPASGNQALVGDGPAGIATQAPSQPASASETAAVADARRHVRDLLGIAGVMRTVAHADERRAASQTESAA